MIYNTVLSQVMAKKIAISGLRYQDLELAYKKGGNGKLKSLLVPKVTKNLPIVKKILLHFEQIEKP